MVGHLGPGCLAGRSYSSSESSGRGSSSGSESIGISSNETTTTEIYPLAPDEAFSFSFRRDVPIAGRIFWTRFVL